ncbi:hypothetical protein J2W28_000230 [Variovorax boronicumulans]|uniref:hypothetical protein n=1 Tax=Variovorax boronicumulans TaxID=436515 RepID=UPI00277F452F|nr:hypothetical protein [Variovorax boronicumulans]MDP9990387.1 hypothetical protein [Variovorax boronicumulans]MDQ0001102.1 hypothetical protein [Variovorax boronicumulans]
MVEDLLFRQPPLDGPPNTLIFGEPDEPASGAAYAFGSIALPLFMASGSAAVTMPPHATAGGVLSLPAFMVTGVSRYTSGVSRPLMSKVSAGWQIAAQIENGAAVRQQAATRAQAGRVSRWQRAAPVVAGVAPAWQDVLRVRASAALRYQEAGQLATSVSLRYQDAERARVGASARWQEAERLATAPVKIRHEEAGRLRRGVRARWQEAVRAQGQHAEQFGAAAQIDIGRLSKWQAAMYPLPGRSVVEPPTGNPCYEPSTSLLFSERQKYSSTLIFICERHGPPPGTGETVVVPILEVYSVENSIALSRVDGGDIIEARGFSMSLDADSWTWQWSATLPGSALPLVQEDSNGDPVELLATVNGVPYRLVADVPARERRFARAEVRVRGKGRAALLDDPYATEQGFSSASGRSAAQLMALAMTINGVNNGWAIDYRMADWFVPGDTWAFQGTPVKAVIDIATAAGAIVQPHNTEQILRILPRYPAAPWMWHTLTPDYVLPADVVSVEGIEWVRRPNYDRAFVYGASGSGVRGDITRSGTAGLNVAPMVVHPLMTHADAITQRGIAELSNTGRQAHVSLRMPVLEGTGLILPGSLVRYDGGDAVRLGLVRAVALDEQWPRLRQTLTVETHVEA